MKNIFGYKFWLYYTTILSTLLIFGGFYVSGSSKNLIIANVLFVPVVLFFWLLFWKYKRSINPENISKPQTNKNITGSTLGFGLLLYSLLLCTIITVGGFAISRSNAEIVSNTIFLPITIVCWYLYYTRPKKTKTAAAKTFQQSGVGNGQHGGAVFNSERMRNRTWDVDELGRHENADSESVFKNKPN